MQKLSLGVDSTLGEYKKIVKAFFGEDSPAMRFIQDKIDESPNGENEEVIADERQMVHLLTNFHVNGYKGNA